METVQLARAAMATRFELVLHGANAAELRRVGEEALAEVERIEAQLSLFRPTSEIARINALADREPVRVTPPVFRLLAQARQLHQETGGAFDITIAPLVRCWGFMHGTGAPPNPTELARVRERIGMKHVILDEESLTVQFDAEGVMLDLGAIGKGYAVEKAVEIIREAGVDSALLHGGTSTIHALGVMPSGDEWKAAIESPPDSEAGPKWVATVPLRDEALSVSAVWGKSFTHEGRTFGHVIDPRSGQPTDSAVLAAVVLPSATETDALSTALLVAGPAGHERLAALRPGMRTLVVGGRTLHYAVESKKIDVITRENIEKSFGNC